MWENLDNTKPQSVHYSVQRKRKGVKGMDALRGLFPEPVADQLNLVLFSTSGVHGTYNTIEDAERFLQGRDEDGFTEITFLILHPRLVALRYGSCDPETQDDIEYLKLLRASSNRVLTLIGAA